MVQESYGHSSQRGAEDLPSEISRNKELLRIPRPGAQETGRKRKREVRSVEYAPQSQGHEF